VSTVAFGSFSFGETVHGRSQLSGDPVTSAMESMKGSLATLQAKLGAAWLANQPGADTDHVLVVLPSHSLAESLLSHYGPRVRALEHRYLVAYLLLHHVPHCER
jgi:hypothetical protein